MHSPWRPTITLTRTERLKRGANPGTTGASTSGAAMPNNPGRPRTTGSKSTPPIVFRVGETERQQAEALALARGLTGPNELARLALLRELAHKAPRSPTRAPKSRGA